MSTPLRIAIAGLGTVGTSVIAILEEQRALLRARGGRELQIVAVSARSKNKERSVSIEGYRFESDPVALASAADVDVVVELIGGAEGAARTLVEAALAQGKHVVTANKALIATHGAGLAELATQKNVSLMFEAAVAGGIPILKLLREGLAANNISRVMGILNGTCNYILTHMWEEKRTFDDVLAEAQKLGYAEADPSFDIDGVDAAHKLAILSSLAYGTKPDLASLQIEGIRSVTLRDMQFADELGYVIRLLGVASPSLVGGGPGWWHSRQNDQESSKPAPLLTSPLRWEGISQRVYPALVAKNSSLAHVRGVFNAVQVETDQAGTMFIQGRGAGGAPTASAVVADIIDIARGNSSAPFGLCHPARVAGSGKTGNMLSSYYIRLGVVDKPGVLAELTAVFRDLRISLKSFLQHGQAPGEKVYIVVATHATSESEMKQALATIAKQPSILEPPTCMRIEE